MITSQFLELAKSRIQEAVKSVEQELNIKIKIGSGRFTAENATIKMEIATVTDTGEVRSKEVVVFEQQAVRFGLKPDDIGKTFTSQGKKFKVTGLNPRRYKFPVNVDRVLDGKKFKFRAETVKSALDMEATNAKV